MSFIILGAGPTGLGAASLLNESAQSDWQIFERNVHVGGLSASFLGKAGFTWDIGGHVLFSHFEYFDKTVAEALDHQWYEHQRESWVRVKNTWVPYPFQDNFRYLPEAARKQCVEGLKTRIC